MRNNRLKTNQKLQDKYGDDWHKIISEMGRKKGLIALTYKWENDLEYVQMIKSNLSKGTFAAQSENSKQKRKETLERNKHQQGEKNSQFGKMWIYNIETFENKKINKDEVIPEGWNKGRKIINKLE